MTSIVELIAWERGERLEDGLRGFLQCYVCHPELSIYLDGLLRCLRRLERRGDSLGPEVAASVQDALGFVPRFGRAGKPRLAFIDHSFHTKTLSSMFFVEFLRTEYEVDLFWSYGWRGATDHHLRSIIAQYDRIVFWQVFPPADIPVPGHKRIFIVPMLDAVASQPDTFFNPYKEFRFIAFGRALARRLLACGLQVTLASAPPPRPIKLCKRTQRDRPRVHFWQRTTSFDWRQVSELLCPEQIDGVWLQAHADPQQSIQMPTASDIRKFNIQQRPWSSGRIEHERLLGECDLYIAPRLVEGIGMSVLEAMAMGCVPVVNDEPALNEYVDTNVGYLYRVAELRPLDIRNMDEKRLRIPAHLEKLEVRWSESATAVSRLLAS